MVKQTLIKTLMICAVAILAINQPTYAQISEFKITASDGEFNSKFGVSVSISGDYAVVGAYLVGSAYVFKRTGESWTQEAKLLASDGESYDWFGESISISGDYVVVGANGDDDNGGGSGSASVFKRSGTSWTQEAKLLPSDGATSDHFGESISISGDYVVVGASGDDDNGDGSGSAYVFKRIGTNWTQEAKLLPSDGATYDWFGESISISGDYVVVGASGDDDNATMAGAAYVFKRSGTSWTQEAQLFASDGATFDGFGNSVSISGDYTIVAASNDVDGDNYGSAYVFKRSGTSWVQEAKLLASDGSSSNDWFGYSVSISGEHAVVGAYRDSDNGYNAGSAYVFKRSGTSWVHEAKLLASDGASWDEFGYSVSVSGDAVVVGTPDDDDNGGGSGSAYVYNGFATPVSVESERTGIPEEFSLSQNYPNPFNPSTQIDYDIESGGNVELTIFNVKGQLVETLVNEYKSPGTYNVKWNPTNLISGIYFYQISIDGNPVSTKKAVYLK